MTTTFLKGIMRKKTQEIQRIHLDSILYSIVEVGRITGQALQNAWKQIVPYVNPRRFQYFLRKNGVNLTADALKFLRKTNKPLARSIPAELVIY